MEFKILYWYWLVFGMVLVMAEIFMPSFTIFWFGLGAIVVSGLLGVLPDMGISWQLFVWVVASSLFALLWFKCFKPLMKDRTKAGISREAMLGEVGHVISAPVERKHGIVRFTTEAIKDNELPVMFLLGEKYVEAIRNISHSHNSKVVALPADVPAAVRGIMSTLGK
ncbi:MAG: NfeD family protein [Thermodesulfobacteriota bacterium]|nr:NfeD family protein [Thermodesulfobacteriota bacterium]